MLYDVVGIKSFAKINLCLNVTGRRNGLHTLDTVIKKLELFDEIFAQARNDDKITVSYSGGESFCPDNALKAGKLFVSRFSTCGADIYIKKNIPVGGGLGGSSADAVGVLRALERLYGTDKVCASDVLSLGSDCLAMYTEGDCRLRGTGEDVERLTLPPLSVAVVCCPNGVSTKDCFALYDERGGEACDVDEILRAVTEKRSGFNLKNSLSRSACLINPEIEVAKKALTDAGFTDIVMTGSGSAVVGIVKENIEEKANRLKLGEGYRLILSKVK